MPGLPEAAVYDAEFYGCLARSVGQVASLAVRQLVFASALINTKGSSL
jgi:hypothetical protein